MNEIFKYLDIAGPLLALIVYYFYSERKVAGHYFVLAFLMAELVTNSAAKYYMLASLGNNIHIYQFNAFITFQAATGWFLYVFKNNLSKKRFQITAVYGAVAMILTLLILFFEDTAYLNSLSYTFISFSICLFCTVFYLSSLESFDDESFVKSTRFSITTAFFIYYAVNFFIFFAYKIFTKMAMKNFGVLWSLHNFILFTACCILAVVCIKANKWKT